MEVGTNKWGNLIPGKEGGALVGDIKRKMSEVDSWGDVKVCKIFHIFWRYGTTYIFDMNITYTNYAMYHGTSQVNFLDYHEKGRSIIISINVLICGTKSIIWCTKCMGCKGGCLQNE